MYISRNNYIFPAILAVVIGIMYWFVFAYAINKAPEINAIIGDNNFLKHVNIYVMVGLGFPALAIFAIVMNMMYKDDGNSYSVFAGIVVNIAYWGIIIAMIICVILMVAGLMNVPRKSIFDI